MANKTRAHGRAPYKAVSPSVYGAKEPVGSRRSHGRKVEKNPVSKTSNTSAKSTVAQPKASSKASATSTSVTMSKTPVHSRKTERAEGIVNSVTSTIGALTSSWKEIALVVTNTALAVGGVVVVLSTSFFMTGVIMIVCGAFLATTTTLAVARSLDVRRAVNEFMQIMKDLKSQLHDAMSGLDSAGSELIRAKEAGARMTSEGAILADQIQGMHKISQNTKKMDENIRERHAELSLMMGQLQGMRASIMDDIVLLDDKLIEVNGMEAGLNSITRAVDSAVQLNKSAKRQIQDLVGRLDVLSADPVVDKAQMGVIIASIRSILKAQDTEDTVVDGIRLQIQIIQSNLDILARLGGNLKQKQIEYDTLAQLIRAKKEEIEILYAEAKPADLQERMDEMARTFESLKMLSAEQAKHLDDSMREMERARVSIQNAGERAEESGAKIDDIKKAAGLATLRDLFLQVGITSAAVGAVVMTGGVVTPLLGAMAAHSTLQFAPQIQSGVKAATSSVGSLASLVGLW